MELVKGVPITKFCDDARLSPRDRLELFVPVCQAIQHAHQKGIIHRDIKPSNVLVTHLDGRPVPKVIDFGIAKAIDQRLAEGTLLTQFGTLVGTPQYMSPEQTRMDGLDIDTRSDVYALGVLLYELLTGSTPLERERLNKADLTEVLRWVREQEATKPSTRLATTREATSVAALRNSEPTRLARLVRGELDWITMKCLEKDRTRRYETADVLARDIQRYLAGEPVEAGPPSTRYKLEKYALKHRAGLAMVSAFITVLLLATAVSIRHGDSSHERRGRGTQVREQGDGRAQVLYRGAHGIGTAEGARRGVGARREFCERRSISAEQKIEKAFVKQPIVEAADPRDAGD